MNKSEYVLPTTTDSQALCLHHWLSYQWQPEFSFPPCILKQILTWLKLCAMHNQSHIVISHMDTN